jgi:phage shock protein PspC (stress-responsive transcriptional regulator)
MNKVISINIGGSIFQVEENAYDKLNAYLNELKKYFGNKPEGNEIITDIENRIAELLRAKITPFKAAINLDDVNEVTASMGAPKDLATEEEANEKETQAGSEEKKSTYTMMNESQPNRVFRDPDGRIVGGVCSGLGHYFKIDPIWIRLFFVIVTITSLRFIFFGASPVLVYIILWIIIPEAKTTAEKLQMRKEKINIDNIQKSVQTEFNKVKDAMENKDFQNKASSFARRLADFIKQLVFGIINVSRIAVRVFLFFLAVVFFIAAIGALTGQISYNNLNSFRGIRDFHFFENNADIVVAQAAVLIGFLAFGFICLLIANALSRNKYQGKTNFALRTTTLVLFITAVVLLVISSVRVATYFASHEKIENIIPLDSAQHHYYLRSTRTDYDHSFPFFINSDTLRVGDIDVVIEPTTGPSEIVITSSAFGQNTEMAKLNASSITALLTTTDSTITIPNSFSISNNQVYRKQELRYKIKLHTGTKLTVDEDYWNALSIGQNNDYKTGSSGNTYLVTADGIECVDCTKNFSGNFNTASYPLNIPLKGEEFKSVKVSSAINVKVVKGNTFMIKARGTSNLHDLDIVFDDDRVSIRDNRYWHFNLWKQNTIEIIVVMPAIENLKISGAVQAHLEGFEEDEINLEISGASSCFANIKANKLIIEQSGATKLTVDGKIKECEAKVSGASKLYAAGSSMKNFELHVSGASYAEVNAEVKLDAHASGASSIRYKGEPKEIISKNSGASSVEKME